MDFSSIFVSLLKKSITDQKSSMQDATSDFAAALPVRLGEKLCIIGKNVDLKIKGTKGDFSFKILLPKHVLPDQIRIEYAETDAVLTIEGPADNQSSVLEISLPHSKEILSDVQNGDIVFSSAAADAIHAKVKNGNIVVKDIDVESADLQTRNGDITMVLPKKVYRLDLAADNGDIVKSGIKNLKDSKRTITANTKNGNITVTGNN